MSYQPPGPYPQYPQHPGGAVMPDNRPPLPQTVLRAHYCMLAGAALAVVSAGITVAQSGTIKAQLNTDLTNAGSSSSASIASTAGTFVIVAACFFAAIEVGLWIWMAYATKAGKNWARILSTVFFGLEATGSLVGGASYLATSSDGTTSSSAAYSGSSTGAGEIVGLLTFLVGLAAIILLWNKASGPYFKAPAAYYPVPYGYPGGPVPYTYPVMPQQPGAAPQQQPADPWATPPNG
ncbi:hypothetical protein KDK95_00920 [Actinospica sp. MGRD01-02]|uniref:Uncharacterized protein n=1 Tax=Actinospica acidithermotolerans TaxID=2828514 RepID=A0A941E4A8_9ACTN|nr:hypothetical protein [Actinospica acidithermotolerans]MBR7824851.1 hypothetical protein [Actinospica acidithermotolerans]